MSALFMETLGNEDRARLCTYLVIPVAIADLLSKNAPLGEEDCYSLHLMLSECDSDSGLLAIALGAETLALRTKGISTLATTVLREAQRIVCEYGSEWLANYHSGPIQEEALIDLLSEIPVDLASLSDLLCDLRDDVTEKDPLCGALCSILSIQAQAHKDIAAYILEELDRESAIEETDPLADSKGNHDEDGICHQSQAVVLGAIAPPVPNNIILFPFHRCR